MPLAPPRIDPKWQRQLTELGGKTVYGQPKLRLVWGGEAREWWKGQLRLRYLLEAGRPSLVGFWVNNRLLPPTSSAEQLAEAAGPNRSLTSVVPKWNFDGDTGIDRWFVEQIVPTSLAQIGWEKEQYELEDGVMVDVLGPKPTDENPYYERAFYMIAEHDDEACCREVKRAKRTICFGKYRDPADLDMLFVEACVQRMNREPYYYSWEQMPPPWLVAQKVREAKAAAAKRSEAEKAKANEILIDGLKARLTPTPFADIGAAIARQGEQNVNASCGA